MGPVPLPVPEQLILYALWPLWMVVLLIERADDGRRHDAVRTAYKLAVAVLVLPMAMVQLAWSLTLPVQAFAALLLYGVCMAVYVAGVAAFCVCGVVGGVVCGMTMAFVEAVWACASRLGAQ